VSFAYSTREKFRRRGKILLFLSSPLLDLRPDDDKHPNGRNRLFDHTEPHNLFAGDDQVDIPRVHVSHFGLRLGCGRRGHSPGEPQPQRISVGSETGYDDRKHDAGHGQSIIGEV